VDLGSVWNGCAFHCCLYFPEAGFLVKTFWVIGGLAAILASCLCLAGCTKQTVSGGVVVNQSFRPLIKPDTGVLAGISMEKLKTTPLYQRHEKALEFPLLDASSQRIGFDPRRDLKDLIFASNGKTGVFLARGQFQAKEIEAKLQSSGLQRSTYKSFTLFGDNSNTLAFLKGGTVMAGSSEVVRSELDFQDSGAGEVPEELQERLRTLPKGDQIWIVSRSGLPFAETPMRSDVQSALSNIVAYIRGVTAGMEVDQGAHLQANLTCISAEGAQRVHDALRGGIGLARLSTKDNETDLLKLYDAIQVDQDGNLVRVHADLSGDAADKLLALLPQVKSSADGILRNQ
jgi:hypothetical protein